MEIGLDARAAISPRAMLELAYSSAVDAWWIDPKNSPDKEIANSLSIDRAIVGEDSSGKPVYSPPLAESATVATNSGEDVSLTTLACFAGVVDVVSSDSGEAAAGRWLGSYVSQDSADIGTRSTSKYSANHHKLSPVRWVKKWKTRSDEDRVIPVSGPAQLTKLIDGRTARKFCNVVA